MQSMSFREELGTRHSTVNSGSKLINTQCFVCYITRHTRLETDADSVLTL